jgi:hypothetical protein
MDTTELLEISSSFLKFDSLSFFMCDGFRFKNIEYKPALNFSI